MNLHTLTCLRRKHHQAAHTDVCKSVPKRRELTHARIWWHHRSELCSPCCRCIWSHPDGWRRSARTLRWRSLRTHSHLFNEQQRDVSTGGHLQTSQTINKTGCLFPLWTKAWAHQKSSEEHESMYEKLIPANAHEQKKKQEQWIIYNHVQNNTSGNFWQLWQVVIENEWLKIYSKVD